MVKVKCPICGVMGHLERRGNSYRIKHYRGYVSKKRLYVTHKIPSSLISTIVTNSSDQSNDNLLMGINGNQNMGIKTLNMGLNEQNMRGRRLAWSRLRDLGSRDPGSNPGDPTKGEPTVPPLHYSEQQILRRFRRSN